MTETTAPRRRPVNLTEVVTYEELAVRELETARAVFDAAEPGDLDALQTFSTAIETATVKLAKAHAWRVENGHASS